MNSLEKEYYELRERERRREEEQKCQALVKCGCPTSTEIPALSIGDSTTLTLASLTVDTFGFCDPNVKLDFTSNIVTSVAFTGTMSLQVYKQCRGQMNPVPLGPSWKVGALVISSSTTFSFFVCDSDICFDDCCTYTVVATIDSILGIALGVSINNATLAATVDSKTPCHRCRNYY